MATKTIVEHIVLFKAKEGALKEDLKACFIRFRALSELLGVVYLHAGAVRTCQPEEGAWTHLLYGRYKDKASLHAYAQHPAHVHAVALADPLFQDKMALDWEAPLPAPEPASTHIEIPSTHIRKPFFPAAHIVLVQWIHHPHAAELGHTLNQVLVNSVPSSSFLQHTCGVNFSPARARGFDWGFAVFFNTRRTPQLDVLVETLACNPSVKRFLCLDFTTDDEVLARM